MTTPEALADLVRLILALESHLSAREIARRLQMAGFNEDKSSVNAVLYSSKHLFRASGDTPPLWSPAGQAPPPPPPPPEWPPVGWLDRLGLYRWQRQALDSWLGAGGRGVVEAVTGAGKTRLALAAIGREIERGGKVAVIVPSIDLQDQWHTEVRRRLVDGLGVPARIGLLGDGQANDLDQCDILIATVQSAYRLPLKPSKGPGLLIADETHHYGAEQWSAALEEGFDRRLGLTATYEREDDGLETYLDPYFGPFRFRLGYREALADDVIARFKVAFLGVPFSDGEREEYDKQDEICRKRRRQLVASYGMDGSRFAVFMQQVGRLAKSGGEGARDAGLYLHAFNKRRQILAGTSAKLAAIEALAPAIAAASRTIIFSQTVAAAEDAVSRAERTGARAGVVHAMLEKDQRQDVFDAFRDGAIDVIAAPRLLDEGVDVPDADLAIVLGTTRSRRQLIQRMGRVVRKKADGRMARMAVLFVAETSEDPTDGACEDFMDMITDAASATEVFDLRTEQKAALEFLRTW